MFDSNSGRKLHCNEFTQHIRVSKYVGPRHTVAYTFSLLGTLGELQLGDKLTKHKLTHVTPLLAYMYVSKFWVSVN